MIYTLEEIIMRFEKIKDHKAKAPNKLNELGEILASAYKSNEDVADSMWEYIINLNVIDNNTNSKFYIAQVFNKILNRLSTEDAVNFIGLKPERVRKMIMYGYDGYKLWDYFDLLVRGFLKINSVDNAILCVESFYEKFGGIWSENKEIFRVAKKAANISAEYINSGEFIEETEQFLQFLGNSENQDINTIVEIIMTIGVSGTCDDYDMLFYVATKCKETKEYFDILWEARKQFSFEELCDKWVEYIKNCEEENTGTYGYVYEDDSETGIEYENSKLHFYVEMEKNEDVLLDYYFSKLKLRDVEKGVITAWIYDGQWEQFIKYISQFIISVKDVSLYSVLERVLKEFMSACFYKDNFDVMDRYGRSNKKLMRTRVKPFCQALAKISLITVGSDFHEDFHELIKTFIQKSNGNLDDLNEIGFFEAPETRSAENCLKDYIHSFFASGQPEHIKNTKYSLIMERLGEELNKKWSYYNTKDEELEQAYRFAIDDEIVAFYFLYCPHEEEQRKKILSACIKMNDIDKAMDLIDKMVSKITSNDKDDKNIWNNNNLRTIRFLIRQYDFTRKENSDAKGITNEMREIVKQLVYKIIPFFPQNMQEQLKREVYKVDSSKEGFATMIDILLNDVDILTALPSDREKVKTVYFDTLSWASYCARLSSEKRLDIIYQVMMKLASAKALLESHHYSGWMNQVVQNVSAENLLKLYKEYPEIFNVWINETTLRDYDIDIVAKSIGSCCTRADFILFKNMVFSYKGVIEGFDDYFKGILK